MALEQKTDQELQALAAELNDQRHALMAQIAAVKEEKRKVQVMIDAVADEILMREESARVARRMGRPVIIRPRGIKSAEAVQTGG